MTRLPAADELGIEMTTKRWHYTADYLKDVFGDEDPVLAELGFQARAAGLPDIAISPDVGRLLSLLVGTTRGERALELGTLGGYSGIWIARGLSPAGRLTTVELEPRHAEFARTQFARAGVLDRIDLRLGAALGVLPSLAAELGPGSLDFAFIDADKTEYPRYWEYLRPLLRVGGIFVADNVLGAGDWWIDDEAHPSRQGVDRLNRAVAADPDFVSAAVPLRWGALIARRVR